jgi:acyl-CoA synthetase (AMP-forming)/AMP-acid ligase II
LNIEALSGLSIGDVLRRSAAAVPDKTAVVDGDLRISYQKLNEMTDALAASLAEIGIEKGNRVAIYMKNSLELFLGFYALQKLGAWAVWINSIYSTNEARFVLENSRARGVFIFSESGGQNFLDGMLDAKAGLPHLENIIAVGAGKGEGLHDFDALIENGMGKTGPRCDIDPTEDIAMFLYTSGTTGTPKGAMICHHAAVRGGYEYSRGVNAGADDVFIGFLSMSHSYGCGAILIQPILLQATVVLMETFEVEKAFQLIEKEKVTLQLAAPAHYILELNHPSRAKYDLSSVRAGMIAGQIAPAGLITQVEKEMNIYITSFWGASEVGPGLGIMCPYPSDLDTRENYVGLPVPGTEVRIVDPVSHEQVEDGATGELTLRGWHMMKGYWERPEETGKQIIDGWLHMGDLASLDENGYIKIFGRTKDLINRGGYKITPYELECVLVEHPGIEQICIVATPNPVLGESTCACVILRKGHTVTLNEIREYMKGKIAPHKLPDELCILDDFPRLSGGVKIKKFGEGGLAELAKNDERREKARK